MVLLFFVPEDSHKGTRESKDGEIEGESGNDPTNVFNQITQNERWYMNMKTKKNQYIMDGRVARLFIIVFPSVGAFGLIPWSVGMAIVTHDVIIIDIVHGTIVENRRSTEKIRFHLRYTQLSLLKHRLNEVRFILVFTKKLISTTFDGDLIANCWIEVRDTSGRELKW